MSEIEKTSQEEQEEIKAHALKQFRENLFCPPRRYVWFGGEPGIRANIEDQIVAVYEGEKGTEDMKTLRLETEIYRGGWDCDEVISNPFLLLNDCPSCGENFVKTTAEQLKDIVKSEGEPSKVLYMRSCYIAYHKDQELFEGLEEEFFGHCAFPFDEIRDELGLKEE